eukprot:2899694-Amphidinium_carterae.1
MSLHFGKNHTKQLTARRPLTNHEEQAVKETCSIKSFIERLWVDEAGAHVCQGDLPSTALCTKLLDHLRQLSVLCFA